VYCYKYVYVETNKQQTDMGTPETMFTLNYLMSVALTTAQITSTIVNTTPTQLNTNYLVHSWLGKTNKDCHNYIPSATHWTAQHNLPACSANATRK